MFAPGRLNLIGEHVDHQGGRVLPLPLALGDAAAWGARPDRTVRVVSLDGSAGDRFTLGTYAKSGRRWADLLRGLCEAMDERRLPLPGLDLVTASDLPAKKGLGSSAAFLVAAYRAFCAATSRAADPAEAADLVQRTEARWGGVRCGVMDPYVSTVGVPGRPIVLDCRTKTHEALSWPEGVEAVPEDTGVARDLSSTPYNERRGELERGLARVHATRPDVRSLRDVTPRSFESLSDELDEPERRRVRHVVTEIARVERAVEALRRGDAPALGRVIDEGHESLSRDFGASTPEIDALVTRRRAEPGVLGVRLQGAGWGGSLVVLRRTSDR